MFQGPNYDTSVSPFISEPVMEWAGHPPITDVSSSEFSTGSAFDATSLVYEVGSCSNTIDTEQ